MHTSIWYVNWEKLVTVSSGLLTPVIAAIAVYIAYQQHVTNRRQHRLALFEQRMKVFNATQNLIVSVLRNARVDLEQLWTFLRETREHEYLFGPEIGQSINDVYRKSVEVHSRLAAGGQSDIEKFTALLEWFSGQSTTAREKFLKYVDFRQP